MNHDPDSRFQDRVLGTLTKHQLIDSGDQVLVAVSGGPDSVALLDALLALAKPLAISGLSVAHFNHQLRGKASVKDAEFVRAMADRLQLDCRMGTEDVAAYRARVGLSLEMAARECRRQFLLETAERVRADKIALGHSANDQAEEVLLRLIRGTGPGGLSAMAPKTPDGIIRPLLEQERDQILRYLQARGLDYRTDATNLEPCCDRNRLRLHILPLIQQHLNPQVVRNLCRHAQLAREEETWWAQIVADRWHEVLENQRPERIVLRRPALKAQPEVIQRRMLKHALTLVAGSFYGFRRVHLDQLVRLTAAAQSAGEIHLPGGVRAFSEYDLLVLTLDGAPCEPFRQPLQYPGTTRCGPYIVTVTRLANGHRFAAETGPADSFTAWLDEDCVCRPLILRTWQAGDRFQPLGMAGSKKLQDLFSDLKVPPRHRKRVPILCDAEKICWVAGYRLDDRVRIRSKTNRLLKVSIQADESLM